MAYTSVISDTCEITAILKKKQHPFRLSLGKARNPSPLEPAPKNIKNPAIFQRFLRVETIANATCTFANAAVAMIFRTKGLEASMAIHGRWRPTGC
jgi:hypothetical protein